MLKFKLGCYNRRARELRERGGVLGERERGRPRGESDAQRGLGQRGGRRGGAGPSAERGPSAGLPGLVREGKEWGAGPRWAVGEGREGTGPGFWFLVSFSFSSSFLFPFLFQTNSN